MGVLLDTPRSIMKAPKGVSQVKAKLLRLIRILEQFQETQTHLDDFLDKNQHNSVTYSADGTRTHCSQNYPEGRLNIINLSSHTLTQVESQVLSLGLFFCPNKSLDNFETVKGIHL